MISCFLRRILTSLVFCLLTPIGYAAEFTVDTTLDYEDVNPGDGVCAIITGECSLRAAIEEANAFAGRDIINIPSGKYDIYFVGQGFKITESVVLQGDPETASIVAADSNIDILNGSNMLLRHLTLQGGRIGVQGQANVLDQVVIDGAAELGMLINANETSVSFLFNTHITNCRLGLKVLQDTYIFDSELSHNGIYLGEAFVNPNYIGGAILLGDEAQQTHAKLMLQSVKIRDNNADRGAAILAAEVAGQVANITVFDSHFNTNQSMEHNVYIGGGSVIQRSQFKENFADYDGAALSIVGGQFVLSESTIIRNKSRRSVFYSNNNEGLISNSLIWGNHIVNLNGDFYNSASHAVVNADGGILNFEFSSLDNNFGGVLKGEMILKATLLRTVHSEICKIGQFFSKGFNIVSDASCGFDSIADLNSTDPLFSNVGFTNERLDYSVLKDDSPALNLVPVSGCIDYGQLGGSRKDGEYCNSGSYQTKYLYTPYSAVEFKEAHYQLSEQAGQLSMTIERKGNLHLPADVHYVTVPDSASTTDFVHREGKIEFPAEVSEMSFLIDVRADDLKEDTEQFYVRLFGRSANITIADQHQTTVALIDGDSTTPGSSNTSPNNIPPNENHGNTIGASSKLSSMSSVSLIALLLVIILIRMKNIGRQCCTSK